MAYTGFIRAVAHRVKIAGKRAEIDAPTTISESLENSTTSVADISLADPASVNYRRGQQVVIDHLRISNSDKKSRNRMQTLFKGVIDSVAADSHPTSVRIRAVGQLGNLRLVTDEDVDLTGMTDQQAVMAVLDTCHIDYDAGKIDGAGYVLGLRQPVIWTAGSSGAQMVEELDRVFAYATIENGKGDVQRIKYSRIADDYDSVVPGRTFYRGQPGVTFYANSRDRGHIERIINFWKITGLEYEIGDTAVDGDGDGIEQEGKEGCSRKIWSECKSTNHKLLGNGVYVGGDFSSDIIQDSGLAKSICIRMLRWYNREEDTLRIECGNDPSITVGDVIKVKDNAPGIDLGRSQNYLVMAIQRSGDLMTLDCLGGDPGDTGSHIGGIEECCGSWADDGTCTPNEQDDIAEPPPMPDLPSIPDDPDEVWCDPALDPTCLPDDGGSDPADPEGPKRPKPPAPIIPPSDTETEQTCSSRGILGCPSLADVCVADGLAAGSAGGGAGDVAWPCAPEGTVPFGSVAGGGLWSTLNQWDQIVYDAATLRSINPSRLKAAMVIASGGNASAANGLMALSPDVWMVDAEGFGYDLHTPEGQVFMAAALLGGDLPATVGMSEAEAFIEVWYQAPNQFTAAQYQSDLILFTSYIEDHCPEYPALSPGVPAIPEDHASLASIASFTGGTGGSSSVNTLAQPTALAVHNGRIYVSDGYGGTFAKVSAFDAATYARVQVYGQSEFITERPSSALTAARGIAIYNDKLYVVDAGANCVMVYDVATGAYERRFGTSAVLPIPYGIAFDPINPGECVIGDLSSKKLIRYNAITGSLIMEFAGAAYFGANGPRGLAFDSTGSLYVCDRSGKRIQVFSNSGINTSTFGTAGTAAGQFSGPSWLVARGSALFILDTYALNTTLGLYLHRVQRWTTAGSYVEQWQGTATSGAIGNLKLGAPIGIAQSSTNIYVTDGEHGTGNQNVRVFSSIYTPAVPAVPASGCSRPAWHQINDSMCDFTTRFSATASSRVYVDEDAYITKAGISSGSATLTFSELETNPNAALAIGERIKSTNLVCISGKARFAHSNGSVSFLLEGWNEADLSQTTPAIAEPSSSVTLYGSGGAVGYEVNHHGVGVSGGTAASLNVDHSFDVCFDFGDPLEPVTITGAFGVGTLAIAGPYCLADFHSVKLTISADGPDVSGVPSTQVWDVSITGVGQQTCGENPYYASPAPATPPEVDEGPSCGGSYKVAIDCQMALSGQCVGDYAENAPAAICSFDAWTPVESSTCLFNQPLRFSAAGPYYHVFPDGSVDRLGIVKSYAESDRSGGSAMISSVLNPASSASASDALFGRGVICVSGIVRFGIPGCSLRLSMRQRTTGNEPISVTHASTQFYAIPGDTFQPPYAPSGSTYAYGVRISNHGNDYGQYGSCGPHTATGATCFNMGGRDGAPLPLNVDLPFETCWDPVDEDNYATWRIGSQRGYLQWQEIPGSAFLHPSCESAATYLYASYPFVGHDLRIDMTCDDAQQWNAAAVGSVGVSLWNLGFNGNSSVESSDCAITSVPADDLG